MKIQYSNKLADRIAYIECQTNTLPFVDFIYAFHLHFLQLFSSFLALGKCQ